MSAQSYICPAAAKSTVETSVPICGQRRLPFVIFAGQSTVDQLADGGSIMHVIQDDHQWDLGCAGFPIDLIGQVG